ncbi:MAG TPA: biotin--[acetyl-CoA-carboxylase] ligase [Solirubrobacteraceae bacterium]|jgi:BirA family biotin operon repressor/biotin-[acetyl-CoA-carboxylase] ligase|nr:biotin--[acetyl-CoA-carboxylase] ligase [Solirubrobacteraceae bacterium]
MTAGTGVDRIGTPRVHFRLIDSTNARARALAGRGAPHGTLVTADEQSAGRGRQGRTWMAPAGRALLCSLVIRDPPRLLPLAAGVAVAETVGPDAQIKWPNDVLLGGRKVAGILVEARLQERWAVVGIGLNVAVREADFPAELRDRAGTLGLEPDAIEPTLDALLRALERWLFTSSDAVLEAVRGRDALRGREVRWSGQVGIGAGIDGDGRLVVRTDAGEVRLDAGEVHLR